MDKYECWVAGSWCGSRKTYMEWNLPACELGHEWPEHCQRTPRRQWVFVQAFPLYHSYNHWMLLIYSSEDLASDVDKIDACLQDETWEEVEMVSFVSKHLLYQSARSFIGDDLFQKILSLLAWNPSYLHSTFLFTKLFHTLYLWSFIHLWLLSSPWMHHAFCGTEPSSPCSSPSWLMYPSKYPYISFIVLTTPEDDLFFP